MMAPAFFGSDRDRRFVHQIWDWQDERRYQVHVFITSVSAEKRWTTLHFSGRYRAITPEEVAQYLGQVDFGRVEVLQPETTGYYQPIVRAVRRS